MNLPNLKDARVRTNKKSDIIRDGINITDDMREFGKGRKYCIFTYGCQMNVHDSENMSGIMEELGFEIGRASCRERV